MPTIVLHHSSGKHYILIGAGYSKWATARPNRFLGDLFPNHSEDQARLVCLCDAQGKIEWSYADQITVISTDGQAPAEALAAYEDRGTGKS